MSINAVAPLAGAWIEIFVKQSIAAFNLVAPLAGAWIEIYTLTETLDGYKRRSTRGSVD